MATGRSSAAGGPRMAANRGRPSGAAADARLPCKRCSAWRRRRGHSTRRTSAACWSGAWPVAPPSCRPCPSRSSRHLAVPMSNRQIPAHLAHPGTWLCPCQTDRSLPISLIPAPGCARVRQTDPCPARPSQHLVAPMSDIGSQKGCLSDILVLASMRLAATAAWIPGE
jgi:hypothetical protein